MKNDVADNRVWDKVKKRLLKANARKIKTGFFEGSRYPPEDGGLPVATVALYQEMGTYPIPPRPFIREGTVEPIKRGKAGVLKEMSRSMRRVVRGTASVDAEYTRIGERIENVMKGAIRDWSFPRNAPSTIKSKGKDDPLVDTERMVNSVESIVER